ncbi:hypothetical protein RLEG12_19260 [Rhizobium leguminosarum bv. trifolii CB782]|nr:hypothetical protein RLEG12_19260 [Rhizobium leguminosarum bv. trifolii CB782]
MADVLMPKRELILSLAAAVFAGIYRGQEWRQRTRMWTLRRLQA